VRVDMVLDPGQVVHIRSGSNMILGKISPRPRIS
jgi:hypothetical protein